VEFALVAPIFLGLIFALMQFGMAAYANAGVRHAVETGARYAVIYPRPSDKQILDRVRTSGYGFRSHQVQGPKITYSTRNGMPVAEISMRYVNDVELIFFSPFRLDRTYKRTVYIAPAL
jgi:hypothetical protein